MKMINATRTAFPPLTLQPPPLSDEQLAALMDRLQAGTRNSERVLCALVRVMLETGARAQELSRAAWEEFDRVKNGWTPKGRSVTPLPMSSKAWEALASVPGLREQGAHVFQRYEISASLFKAYLKALGIEPFPLLMLRKEARRRLGLDAPSNPDPSATQASETRPHEARSGRQIPSQAPEPGALPAMQNRAPMHLRARELSGLLKHLRDQGGEGERIYRLTQAARRTFLRGSDDQHLNARWELLCADLQIGFAFLARLEGWAPDPFWSAPPKWRR